MKRKKEKQTNYKLPRTLKEFGIISKEGTWNPFLRLRVPSKVVLYERDNVLLRHFST